MRDLRVVARGVPCVFLRGCARGCVRFAYRSVRGVVRGFARGFVRVWLCGFARGFACGICELLRAVVRGVPCIFFARLALRFCARDLRVVARGCARGCVRVYTDCQKADFYRCFLNDLCAAFIRLCTTGKRPFIYTVIILRIFVRTRGFVSLRILVWFFTPKDAKTSVCGYAAHGG